MEFLICLALIVTYIRWKNYKLRDQNERLEQSVFEKTKNLTLALKDKDIILKELHHRVKNNLQIITGLLQLQKDELTDIQATKAISEGQLRLSTISLIHQNFYSGKNLETIQFKAFLSDLIVAINDSFKQDFKSINYEIDVIDFELDINRAIPFGLIITEILSISVQNFNQEQLDKNIKISILKKNENNLQFIFEDNCAGFDQTDNFQNMKNLQMKLIKGLSKQIKNDISYKYQNGNHFTFQYNIQQNN